MSVERLVPEPVYEEFVSELFHENTKQHRSDARFIERILAATFDPGVQSVMSPTHKLYPGAVRIEVPRTFAKSRRTFDDALLNRRSKREFAKTPLPFGSAMKLLHYTYGITGTLDAGPGHEQLVRAAPSGGALFPIELYVLARNVVKVPPGIYHFNAGQRCLERVSARDPFGDLVHLTYAEELREAALAFVLTGVSIKSRVKYGERGYRFMLLEAGHIAQNFLLTSTALGLNAFSLGGFVDDELDRLLQVDGFEETALYVMAAGKPGKPVRR
jgi:SagB-type dehydrogenase family enzyme